MTLSLRRLWADDTGMILATELIFLLAIVVIGTLTALVALRQAFISEAIETSQAIMSLNQSYWFSGQSHCAASTAGSSASDTTNTIIEGSTEASTATVNQFPCD